MNNLLIYKCAICGNTAAVIEDSGVTMMCCGNDMDELKANSTDAAGEKHVPVITKEGDAVIVSVGSIAHPMTPEHGIAWVILATKQGFQIKYLDKAGEPKAKFVVSGGDEFVSAYEYCNLHGLWKA